MKEAQDGCNEVELHGLTSPVLNRIIEFIYTVLHIFTILHSVSISLSLSRRTSSINSRRMWWIS